VLREQEMAERAETYREMADQAIDARLRLEFAERAERYETAVWAIKHAKAARRGASEHLPPSKS